jgi:hypothetical protein
MAVLSPTDVISELSVEALAQQLRSKRRYGSLQRYGNAKFEIPNSDLVLESLPASVFAYVKAAQKHSQYIVDNAFDLLVVPFMQHGAYVMSSGSMSERQVVVKHAGLQSSWSADQVNEWLGVRSDWLAANLEHAVLAQDGYGRDVVRVELPQVDNPNGSLFISAFNKARLSAYKQFTGGSIYGSARNEWAYHQPWRTASAGIWVPLNIAATAVNYSQAVAMARPSSSDINEARMLLLGELADAERAQSQVRKRISLKNFATYWGNLKESIKSRVDDAEVFAAFDAVPINPAGSKASRTWGIEIETVQAQLTSRPRGWDQRGDGSLESMSSNSCGYDYCDCDCYNCSEDGDHDSCYSEDSSNCAEFVSPILRHFNSDGLRQLCADISDAPCNTSPGIHVHVGADDLTPFDVARLVRIYSVISPFLIPYTKREVFGYCKDISTDNVAHWLSVSRDLARSSKNISVADGVTMQPDDRYRDLNLQAIHAHGTIEFRAMGPVYDYKHLVRWAWLCRELTNISKLDLPDSLWRNVTSMADILNIVYEYGSETSDTVMSPLESAYSLDLTAESDDEAIND